MQCANEMVLGWSWYDGVSVVSAQNQKQLFGHPGPQGRDPLQPQHL